MPHELILYVNLVYNMSHEVFVIVKMLVNGNLTWEEHESAANNVESMLINYRNMKLN
jgi:hypothetical protein